ncbi:SUKH-4 family immunity protein [Streptomyces pharetrae]|uniref:SUKH-4 family immunity protein n=1 Tax=Streptomyces pharetrae TaxID=291370 RepID=UPI0033548873
MDFVVQPDDMISAFGLSGVVYFPLYDSPASSLDRRTAEFLSRIGLPDVEYFKSKASVGQEESIRLAEWFSDERGFLPEECREWLVIAYFAASLIALDPVSGKLYAFGEGEPLDAYEPIHRDVESLAYALLLFKRFEDQERGDEELEEHIEQLRRQIESFDPLPFTDEQSQWSLVLEEVLDGIW